MSLSLHRIIIENGSIAEFKAILNQESQLIYVGYEKMVPIVRASTELSKLIYVRLILDHQPQASDNDQESYGDALWNLLKLKPTTSQEYHLLDEVLLALINSGIDLSRKDYLNRAESYKFSTDIIKALISNGAQIHHHKSQSEINPKGRQTYTYLPIESNRISSIYASSMTRNPDNKTTLQQLVERIDAPNITSDLISPLWDDVIALLQHGADWRVFNETKPLIHLLAEQVTVKAGEDDAKEKLNIARATQVNTQVLDALYILMNHNDFDKDALNENDQSALQVLANDLNKYNIEIFCALINAGANLERLKSDSYIANKIVMHAGTYRKSAKSFSPDTPKQLYFYDRLPDYARQSLTKLKEAGFSLDAECDADPGRTPLQLIMMDKSQEFSIDAAIWLIKMGASVDTLVHGKTILHCFVDSTPGLFERRVLLGGGPSENIINYRFQSDDSLELFTRNLDLLLTVCDSSKLLLEEKYKGRNLAGHFSSRNLASTSRFNNPKVEIIVRFHIKALLETQTYPKDTNAFSTLCDELNICPGKMGKGDRHTLRNIAAKIIEEHVNQHNLSNKSCDNTESVALLTGLLMSAIDDPLFKEHGPFGGFFSNIGVRDKTKCVAKFETLLTNISPSTTQDTAP